MKHGFVSTCVAAVALVTAAGCGSDSPPGRASVTNALVKSAKDSGIEIDKGCVSDVVAKFSDDDFKILQASAAKDDLDTEDLSNDGQALLVDLFDCSGGTEGGSVPTDGDLSTSQAAILEQITSTLEAQGLDVDEDCLKDLVSSIDSATIANQDSEALTQIGTQAAACVKQP